MHAQRLIVSGLVAATAIFVVAPSSAGADERVCRGSLGRVTVDNLRVPVGSGCKLDGTIVRGNIKVERAAILDARSVRVGGNVQAERAAQVNVSGWSNVEGNIQVKQGGGSIVRDVRVGGDIQFDENRGGLRSERNNVGSNIQVMKNRGGAYISENRVDGDLQCKENAPAPRGFGNVVRGDMEDQCRRLVK